jgi:hypothetical protein
MTEPPLILTSIVPIDGASVAPTLIPPLTAFPPLHLLGADGIGSLADMPLFIPSTRG